MEQGSKGVASPDSSSRPPYFFKQWQPGPLDAVRGFLLSERFQSATQLAAGVLFVSLFVFVDALRFPGACVAILLYFVVAVTAAPDCHVGTRIFLCGFMLGPMWLSLLLGGVIVTLAKLAPSQEGTLIILCVLGPLALIPFSINRMGTSHLYMFAMGMVSCLYLGMPILAGWAIPDFATLWERAVGYVLVAALIGMFAGSVLSMIVLPSLASHKLEDEVSTALKYLGQHLSGCASMLWRPGKTSPAALPPHLEGLHPLLLHSTQAAEPGEMAPGLLDRDTGAAQVSPWQVYAAAMDWFEHLSRPPSDPGGKRACLAACRSTSLSDGGHSERVKSTFYGPSASTMAAAVAAAAAAQDGEEEEQWQEQQEQQEQELDGLPALRSVSWAGSRHANSHSSSRHVTWRPSSMVATAPGGGADAAAAQPSSANLRLGSTVTAASVSAAKAAVLQGAESSGHTAEGTPVYSVAGSKAPDWEKLYPSISGVRQLLAHAHQLLDPAGAEPQWLRSGERRFHVGAWTKLVAAAQLVALRMTALDLLLHDFVSLSEEPHSFPVAEELSQLLQQLYGSAAAALALLSEQIRCREQLTETCTACQDILKHPSWLASRQQLLQLLEATLSHYFLTIQQATPEQPVTIPSAHWVRRWMFFHTTTLSLMDALDALAATAQAALTTQQPQHSLPWWKFCGNSSSSSSSDSSKQGSVPQQQHEDGAPSKSGTDVEVGLSSDVEQQQQQQQQEMSSSIELASQPSPAVLGSLVSMRLGSQDAAAAADAAAGPVLPQQQASAPKPPHALPAAAPAAQQHIAAAPQQQPTAAAGSGGFKASFAKHTAWVKPWLPLALNVEQYKNLRLVFTQEVPRALSSKQAFLAAVRNRRVQAAVKYWGVLVIMMVGTLLLQYFRPVMARMNPTFGYTAVAVGMSDRVESTVFKVAVWTGATIVGAALGWAMMTHPAMALNTVALCAVMVAVSFGVGILERGPTKGGSLFTLFTLTTFASIVLCQCCGHVGSTWVSLMRAASVIVAAVIAVSVQNLVLPWYTSAYALEQLGLVYREATEVLADLLCQLYEDTEQLLQQQQQQQQGGGHSSSLSPAAAAGSEGAAAAAAAAWQGEGNGVLPGGDSSSGGPLHRLQLLDDAVRRLWEKEQQQQQQPAAAAAFSLAASEDGQQQQQQQQQQQAKRQPSITAAVAANRLGSIGRMFTGSSQLEHLLQPSQTGMSAWGAAVRQRAAKASTASSAAGDVADETAAALKSAIAAGAGAGVDAGQTAACEMLQLLQKQRQKYRQQQGAAGAGAGVGAGAGSGRVAVTGLQLQGRLVRPLVQVKISLILDATAWKSGPLATPTLVTQMLGAMFDLVDALAALQQAVAMPVKELSGSWDWTLLHSAGALGALLLQAMQLADATAAHLLEPTADTAQQLLMQVQELQHKRFEYFAVQRELRRLLHTALATDPALSAALLPDGRSEWQLQGHLRYSACVYAVSKVMDRITAGARGALRAYK